MAHPTGARAPLPTVSPEHDAPSLALKATAQIETLREAYHAAACVHELLLEVQRLPKDKRHIDYREVEALIDFIDAECQRRAQACHATIAAMHVPPTT